MEEVRGLATDFADTFVQGILSGEKAVDLLSSALKQLGSQLASSAIRSIIGQIFPTPGTAAGIFHSGGVVTAHNGMAVGAGLLGMNSDERLIVAQTGERILSRNQVAWGGKGGGDMFSLVFNNNMSGAAGPHAGMMTQIADFIREMLDREVPGAVRRARANRTL